MKTARKLRKLLWLLVPVLALSAAGVIYFSTDPWGFARSVSPGERGARLAVVETAQQWLGKRESDGSHREIVDLYNSHEPLAQGYQVTYTDSWCATFVSAVAIRCGITDILPTECSCQRQIGLFQELGRWEERDSYLPLPGDVIYYCWGSVDIFGDCTDWADHVGIVVGTAGPFLKVIEGNRNDCVGYRYVLQNDIHIRGFGLPDYG